MTQLPDGLQLELNSIEPASLTLVADMTGTLLLQKENGFPEADRKTIRRLIDSGAEVLIVTGDSAAIADEQFIKPLNYTGRGELTVISGSGFSVDQYCSGKWSSSEPGESFPEQARVELLKAIKSIFESNFGSPNVNILSGLTTELLSDSGGRVDFATAYERCGETAYVELRSYKATIFFPCSEVASNMTGKTLSDYAAHEAVNKLKSKLGLHVHQGDNYVDVISTTKDQALNLYFSSLRNPLNEASKNSVIVLGDSPNDHGLYSFKYSHHNYRVGVFLGERTEFYDSLVAENLNLDLYNLKGTRNIGAFQIIRQVLE